MSDSSISRGPNRASTLPTDPKERKKYPIASGVLDYFPDAIVAIAHLSWKGNEQHNPGEPLHWARHKSTDQDDTIIRHFMERGKVDSDGIRHTAKLAWRALALLQLEIEADQQKVTLEPGIIIPFEGRPKVGDVLPTTYGLMCDSFGGRFSCTLPKGHSGPHVGQGTDGRVLGVWE